jgi:hypothetical protein
LGDVRLYWLKTPIILVTFFKATRSGFDVVYSSLVVNSNVERSLRGRSKVMVLFVTSSSLRTLCDRWLFSAATTSQTFSFSCLAASTRIHASKASHLEMETGVCEWEAHVVEPFSFGCQIIKGVRYFRQSNVDMIPQSLALPVSIIVRNPKCWDGDRR